MLDPLDHDPYIQIADEALVGDLGGDCSRRNDIGHRPVTLDQLLEEERSW